MLRNLVHEATTRNEEFPLAIACALRLVVAEKSSSEQESTEQADSSTPAGYTFIVTFLTMKLVGRVARAFALFVVILPLVTLCHSGVDAQNRCRK